MKLRTCPGVAGDDVQRRAEIPVRHRNPRVGRHGQRRGHAGNHLKVNSLLRQKLQLLAAPPEQEGVAALEPHHPLARLRLLQQNPIDLLLGHQMVAGLLAHVDGLRLRGNQRQNGRTHQPVKYHDLGLLQGLTALLGQQSGITGACAHQDYIALHLRHIPFFSASARAIPRACAWDFSPIFLPRRTTVSSALTYRPVRVSFSPSTTA